jgi:hypothetical protein
MTSLSEIANIKGDADLAQGGFGADAILPENNTALAYLANATNLQAGANKYLAEVHNQRLQDYLNNFSNIDLKNLAPGDYDNLSNQYVDLSKDLADNYDVIQNPFKNPELAGSLRAREAALRSQIAQSQMDKGMMDVTANHMALHPDLNTAENQQKIQDFWKTPLGQRTPVALTPAPVLNLQGIADNAWNTVQQKYATAGTDGKYIWKKEGLTAAAPAYLNAVDAHLNDTDSYGRTNRQLVTNAFNQLSPEDQAQYDNNPLNYYHTQMLALKHPDQQTKNDLETNQYGTIGAEGAQTRKNLSIEEAFQAHQNDLNRDNALTIAGLKGIGGKGLDKNAVGEYKNRLYHDFVTGTGTDQIAPVDLNTINNDPNLSYHDKIAKMNELTSDALNNASYGKNIPNEILQGIYGDNTKIKVKTGLPGETQVEEDAPKETVIGNRLSNDGKQAFITLKNNATGQVHNTYVPLDKFYNDLDNVLGPQYAPQVSQASNDWLQNNTGSNVPNVNKIGAAFMAPPIKSTYQTADGKTYSHEQLRNMGYSDDKIRTYQQAGIIK